MNGKSSDTGTDGNEDEGEFGKGNKHGQGNMIYANGNKYEGEWNGGYLHGQGIYTWTDGNKYEGEWKDGKRHGQGIMTYANGNKYVGEFKDGRPTGGWYYWSNGQKTWSHKNTSGEWVHSTKDEGVEELPN